MPTKTKASKGKAEEMRIDIFGQIPAKYRNGNYNLGRVIGCATTGDVSMAIKWGIEEKLPKYVIRKLVIIGMDRTANNISAKNIHNLSKAISEVETLTDFSKPTKAELSLFFPRGSERAIKEMEDATTRLNHLLRG